MGDVLRYDRNKRKQDGAVHERWVLIIDLLLRLPFVPFASEKHRRHVLEAHGGATWAQLVSQGLGVLGLVTSSDTTRVSSGWTHVTADNVSALSLERDVRDQGCEVWRSHGKFGTTAWFTGSCAASALVGD